MFERYAEKARRAIFYSRYEASQYGSPYIETEFLLLGVLREDPTIAHRFLGDTGAEEIRKQVDAARQPTKCPKVSTSVDLPLSNECKRVLAYAAEEAERLSHRHMGTEHLFLGLLREEKSFAAILLFERGVRLDEVRKVLDKGIAATYVVPPPFPGDMSNASPEQQIVRPEIEFVCGEATVCRLFSVGPLQRVPLIGEEVILNRRSYRVEGISSTFETPAQAPHDSFLARVVIKLKES